MGGFLPAIRIGLLDMRGDLRRFVLLVVCLAVGTALIAGVGSVGASITRAVDQNAALFMGGDLELSRADRLATDAELAQMRAMGRLSTVIDTNVRAENGDNDAFVDLMAVGDTYPLLGQVGSPDLPLGQSVYDLLGERDGVFGALVDPLMLDQLGIAVGDTFILGGTLVQARGALSALPDAAVRGFRLGLTALVSTPGFSALSDLTSPLPGLGTWYRYKLVLDQGDAERGKAALEPTLGTAGWTIRSARDGLGPMVRYYDLFMRFLVVVGLGSLLIGGVSVWTVMQAYIAERASVIAVLRSIGADRSRIFVHFFAQVAALAAIGVGIGLLVGAGTALVILPMVGEAVGIALAPQLDPQPLLVAAGVGLLTAFAFSYLPLQQAQAIRPVLLFRSRGLAAAPIDWRGLLGSWQVLPLIVAVIAFFLLAWVMTGDGVLVGCFGLASAAAAILLRVVVLLVQAGLQRLPERRNRPLRHALRAIAGARSNASAVVISVGMALTMLCVVLVLQDNLRNEFLGASVFDAPTLVATDLFPDEVDTLQGMAAQAGIARFTATPMLRGALTAIDGVPTAQVRTHGPEATFLLSGEVPLTYRQDLPASSKLVAGQWWPADYEGPGLVSLHQSLRTGLGVDIGDTLTFTIFGEDITVQVASFRDYSWQGGVDFLATFSPGVLDNYPATLFGSVTAMPGREEAVERTLAGAFPDIRFIAIGETLRQITEALGQLSFAAALIGALAVGNGFLALVGSLASGRRQRQADAVITKTLGATWIDLMGSAFIQYLLLAAFAAIPATALGIGLGWLLTLVLLDVDFSFSPDLLAMVDVVAVCITGVLGAMAISRAVAARPARLLRDL